MNKLETMFLKKPKSLVKFLFKKSLSIIKVIYLAKQVVDVHKVVNKSIAFVPKIMQSVLLYVNVRAAKMTKCSLKNVK